MGSSDEEVLLESCCFLLNYNQEQIKRKRKRMWVQEILFKKVKQGIHHDLLQEMHVNDRDSYFRLFVYIIMNFLANILKKYVRPFKV